MKNRLENEIVYFYYLRVFAAFAVIILHISSQNWENVDVHSLEWTIFNIFESLVRWCVPVFVMISGAIFLDRDIKIKNIYSKYILRLIISFSVWSFVYLLFQSIINKSNSNIELISIVYGHYHMWFVLMIIGIYICIPIFKLIIENREITIYFLMISFIISFLNPSLLILADDLGNNTIKMLVSMGVSFINSLNINVVLGYSSYFILGYIINITDFNKKQRTCIYLIGIIGLLFTGFADYFIAIKTGEPCDHYYGNFSVNILFESVAIFVLFKYADLKKNNFVCKLSKYSFGAYMVHALIIELLDEICGLNTLSIRPIFSVLILSIIVFLISFILSAILNNIPIVRKYIV